MTTKAPVGPPICTANPPRREIRTPATMAVLSPNSGERPLAMANAVKMTGRYIPTGDLSGIE